jgi:serine/threonine-protein phosphatase PGAM5
MKSPHIFGFVAALAMLSLAPIVHAADAPAAAAPPKPRGVHYIYLIRHGMYDRDTVNTDDRVGSALNALGHEQAKLIGERLAKLPVKLHALVSSDFTRARETADDMGRAMGMTPVLDSLIHECTPTSERADIMKTTTADEIALCETNLQAAWNKYVTPTPAADTHDVLVCHGNVIRWMVARVIEGNSLHWSRMDIGNGSLTVLAVRSDGSIRLVMYSDVGHIPVEKQTWTGRGAGWAPPPARRGAGGMR